MERQGGGGCGEFFISKKRKRKKKKKRRGPTVPWDKVCHMKCHYVKPSLCQNYCCFLNKKFYSL